MRFAIRLGLLAALLGAAGLAIREIAGTAVARRVLEDPRSAALPAPLSQAHAEVPELVDCAACHSMTSGVEDDGCLACHEEIGERLAAGSGHHGRNLTGACRDCHAEHRPSIVDLDRDAFNHRQALWPLEGAHAGVDCGACHEVEGGFRWLGLAFGACADCHEDPHRAQFGSTACEACHDQNGFRGRFVLFSHDRSRFRLTGAHQRVACARCHERSEDADRYRGVPDGCADCHSDPHSGSFRAQECRNCHTTAGWAEGHLTFDHQTSRFPLDAAHRTLDCTDCHRTLEYRKTPSTCEACHADVADYLAGRVRIGREVATVAPDVHAGKATCVECHDTKTSAHQSLDSYAARCVACHTPAYADTYLDWTARLASLAREGRELAGPKRDPELEAFLRVGTHGFVEAERRVRQRLEALRR